jgi:hypothetical protein
MRARSQPSSFARFSRSPWSASATLALVLAGAASLGALVAPAPARASMVRALDLAGLTAGSTRIVVGEVIATSSAFGEDRRRIFTTIEVQVAELWKGAMPSGGRFKFVQLGGSVGDLELKVHGLPSFQTGDRAVLFLGGEGLSSYLVGLGQGARPLRYDVTARRWMVQPGDRSAAVVRQAEGTAAARRLVAAPPESAVPLDELRSQVRALVR